jgi:tetratricopeptide (TPR) repeat protein
VAEKYPETQMAYFNIGGYHLFEKGQAAKALPFYEKALQIKPDDAPTLFKVGMAFNKLGHPDKALAWFLKARELAPRVPQIHYNIGVLLRESGKAEEGRESILKAQELDPANPLYRQ